MIVDVIGEPAVLEQLAEECAELCQVALKKARVLRKENPTPKKLNEVQENFIEEIADVLNCIHILVSAKDFEQIENIGISKLIRWENRLKGVKK